MSTLWKLQAYFFAFITVYMLSAIAAMVMGMVWLGQSADGAPRDAVISREIEKSKCLEPFFFFFQSGMGGKRGRTRKGGMPFSLNRTTNAHARHVAVVQQRYTSTSCWLLHTPRNNTKQSGSGMGMRAGLNTYRGQL